MNEDRVHRAHRVLYTILDHERGCGGVHRRGFGGSCLRGQLMVSHRTFGSDGPDVGEERKKVKNLSKKRIRGVRERKHGLYRFGSMAI